MVSTRWSWRCVARLQEVVNRPHHDHWSPIKLPECTAERSGPHFSTVSCDLSLSRCQFTTFWKRDTPRDSVDSFQMPDVLEAMARAQRPRAAESQDRQCSAVGREDSLYESFLNPLTSSHEVVCAASPSSVRTWGGLPGGHGIRKKTQEGCKASVGGAAQKADERRLSRTTNIHIWCARHSPELRPCSLQLEVKRPTRHRWCSGLGRGTAPSSSNEGPRTLHGSKVTGDNRQVRDFQHLRAFCCLDYSSERTHSV